jgi:hypothetical protein
MNTRLPRLHHLPSLRRNIYINTTGTILEGYRVRGPDHVRVARERNRITAILRHAKAIPVKPGPIHPITQEVIPLSRGTCHTCGRQFFHRPRPPHYEINPRRKYCHPTCQNSRPFVFDRWLEKMIMKVLATTHRVKLKKVSKPKFRCISTDTIENYVLRHRGNMFKKDLPLHLRERIRQAARRLVGIPGRSGDVWQVVALERNSDAEVKGNKKWVRRLYAPDRGKIILGLVEADVFRKDMKELSPVEAGLESKSLEQEMSERKIDGRILQDVPQWAGRFWWDDSGRIRPAKDRRRTRYSGIIGRRSTGDDLLGTKWAEKQSLNLKHVKFKGAGWSDLLRQNKDVIDALTAQRNKDFGLE